MKPTEHNTPGLPKRLKILTWNLSYGYGYGSDGIQYVHRDKIHYEMTLNAMSEFIRNVGVDIALLQEVDFDSHRSHHIDQLDWLARSTGLLYRQPLVSWNRAYVPYPGKNPKNHFGKIKSGGGILSRYPIEPILSDLLPKPRANGKLYNYFYLSRFLQLVSIGGIRFMNLHLEAFSKENRELHLIKVHDRFKDYEIDVAGGDFNGGIVLPEDESESHGRAAYEVHPASKPTYPSHDPSETLDGFIIKKGQFSDINVSTLDAGSVSDHFPVLIELTLSSSPQV